MWHSLARATIFIEVIPDTSDYHSPWTIAVFSHSILPNILAADVTSIKQYILPFTTIHRGILIFLRHSPNTTRALYFFATAIFHGLYWGGHIVRCHCHGHSQMNEEEKSLYNWKILYHWVTGENLIQPTKQRSHQDTFFACFIANLMAIR